MLIDVGKKLVVDILFNSQNEIEFLRMYAIVIIFALMSVFNAYLYICLHIYVYVWLYVYMYCTKS